jgi:Membrane-associated lipoprotein involved in thiamine biosynthesis
MFTGNTFESAAVKTFSALGTINYIKIYGGREPEKILKKVTERISEIESRMSAFLPDSDVSRLRRNAGNGFVKISEETFGLIKTAVEFGELTDGAFDITVRPLVELWGIGKKGTFIPSPEEIRQALRMVNYKDIELDEEICGAALKHAGQSVDLGSIAKGYAADEVKRILLKNGIQSAMVNLGGNVMAVGSRPDGQPWKIGIQNPLAPTGEYLGVLSVTDKTVVTSGSNERFFIKDGVRYHHILDPRTGAPAQGSLLSVTAVCGHSAQADALTTALFLRGPEKSALLLRETKTEAIFIDSDLSVTATCGLKNIFTGKRAELK